MAKKTAKFIILHGCHRVKGVKGKDGSITPGVNFKRGDVVESEIDLEKRHPEKFRRVSDDKKVTPRSERIPTDDDKVVETETDVEELAETSEAAATLSQMSVDDLRKLAVDEGIDVSKAKNKAELIKLISMVQE